MSTTPTTTQRIEALLHQHTSLAATQRTKLADQIAKACSDTSSHSAPEATPEVTLSWARLNLDPHELLDHQLPLEDAAHQLTRAIAQASEDLLRAAISERVGHGHWAYMDLLSRLSRTHREDGSGWSYFLDDKPLLDLWPAEVAGFDCIPPKITVKLRYRRARA